MKLYKVLGNNGKCCNGGDGSWHLPKGKRKGKWMPFIEDLIPCTSGYHLCRAEDLLEWLNEEIYEVEHKGKMICAENKVVVQQARLVRRLDTWNERTARSFAVECAKRALKVWDKYYPEDKRPHEAVRQAYLFALGKTTREQMVAAMDAAWAARNAASDAADAARNAARASAWAAEAARDAAWAAEAAAWAARAAAWAAASDAAEAARDAAWDAERKWQTRTLKKMLGI